MIKGGIAGSRKSRNKRGERRLFSPSHTRTPAWLGTVNLRSQSLSAGFKA